MCTIEFKKSKTELLPKHYYKLNYNEFIDLKTFFSRKVMFKDNTKQTTKKWENLLIKFGLLGYIILWGIK